MSATEEAPVAGTARIGDSLGDPSGRYEVVVVGGGQAGLAIGYFLVQQERRFRILEATDAATGAWRARWDSLKLFTPVRYDSLPGRPFPGDPDTYPGRDDVVAYLTDYARACELPVELNSPVRTVRRDDGGYLVELDDRTYAAEQVVIATGPFQIPRGPTVAQRLDRGIVQFHSTDYRRPDQVPAGTVLVVGGGNTGFQIAEDLSRSHEVHLSIGSRQTPLPQRIAGRDLFRYLEATGLMRVTVDSRLGQRLRYRETLIGSSPHAARRRHGIRLRGRAVQAEDTEVRFSDGSQLTPATVIWATGFAIDHSFVQVPVFDDAGRLMHRRGVTATPGLYFLGLTWQHTRGSALLGWVKNDAEFIAERIAAYANGKPAAAVVQPATGGRPPR
jgi:putative flavoprotein involved in K+ transport